jgi:FKBP-type peptidyl-prolyl cis-trans isomerase
MTRKRDRMFALFGALLFLITSSALTVAVIYTIIEQDKTNKSSGSSTAASTTNKGSTTASATASKTTSTSTNLAGTKMQNFTPLAQPLTKLEVSDTTVGTGAEVKAGDTITADYVGALADTGVIFDASADHGGPISFPLNQVIAGWTQGIPGMRIGGTRRLLIPASLAYGAQAQTGIPANSDLVFDVTVTKIN